MMALHPLTPRKPIMAAALAGTAIGALIAASAFAAGLLVLPPAGWLPDVDKPQIADLEFFYHLTEGLLQSAATRSGLLAMVSGVLDLPTVLLDTVRRLDLGTAMTARVVSATAAGAVYGNFVFDALRAGELARQHVQHVAGPKLLSHRAARRMLKAAWFRRFGSVEPGIELAEGLRMPRQLEVLHILLAGGTGAGKTTILQALVGSAAEAGDKMLLLDVKGDMTACLPIERFALLSVEDARSAAWIPGLDFITADDATELAIELIPSTGDPSWSSGARQVFAALIKFLQAEAAATKRAWTWSGLNDLMCTPIEDIYRILAGFEPSAATFIDVTREETLKLALSFYLVMMSGAGQAVSTFARLGATGRQSFSIRQWLQGNDNRQAVIVRQSQRLPELTATMARLVLKVAADAAAERAADPNPNPVWFFLDEIPQVGKTAAVPRLATLGRSAGIRLVISMQSPSQLREIYGPEASQTLLDNMTTKIVGRVASGATAEEVSTRWIGNRRVEWWETAGRGETGRLRSEKRSELIPVIDPNVLVNDLGLGRDFSGRPIIRALVVGHDDVALLQWPVGIWPTLRSSLKPIGTNGSPEK